MSDVLRPTSNSDVDDRSVVGDPAQSRAAPLRIEIAAALERMGNNKPLFATIAEQFVETSHSLMNELRASLQVGAHFEAAKILHQLRGLAGTVGNTPFAEMASRLETKLKRTNHVADVGNDLPRLESLLAAGNAELRRLQASFDVIPEALEGTKKPQRTVNPGQKRSLIALLEARNLSALDVYHKLAPALKATLPAERHAVLVAAIDGLDFAAAATALGAAERIVWP